MAINERQRQKRLEAQKKKRKLVEMVFGWGKLDSIMRKIKLHGVDRVDWCSDCSRRPTIWCAW